MRYFQVLCISVLLWGITAQSHSPKSHRHAKAHVHGQGRVDIAFEKNQGRIEIEVPVESILDFEHEPKNEKEKAAQEKVLNQFKNEVSRIIVFDSRWNCDVKTREVQIVGKGHHRDLRASYDLQCEKLQAGVIEFQIQTHFPKWKKAEVQLITENHQSRADIQKSGQKLELK